LPAVVATGVAVILAVGISAVPRAGVPASASGSTRTLDTTQAASGFAGSCQRLMDCAGGGYRCAPDALRVRSKRKSRAPSLRKGPRARLSTLPRVKLDLETPLETLSPHATTTNGWLADPFPTKTHGVETWLRKDEPRSLMRPGL
jgi:hypothetical protein